MTVTKELVQALRARTNAGILDCKKFLIETNGDVDAAAQKLREAGIAKADKKLSRQTSEGRVFGAVDQSGTSDPDPPDTVHEGRSTPTSGSV